MEEKMRHKKILVCDDEKGVRESLSLILSDKYDVVFTQDADDALKQINTKKDIALILLDIKMPGKNGIEALKDMRSCGIGIPVIIITGYQSIEAVSEITRQGAADYITKPFDSKTVLEAVEKALG
jgi:DNA-binding NtrC family response regulator